MLRSMAKYSRATGPVAAARQAARSGSPRTLRMPSASGPGATAVRRPAPELAQELLVVAEVGRHDRPAGGEVDGDLALDRVVLAAGQPGMDQDVGAAGQRDDLLGGLAGQDDQPVAVRAELGPVALAGLGRAADQHATGIGPGLEDLRQGVDQDRHALVGVDDAADVHDDLVLGTDAGDRRRLPGRSYSARSMPG